MGNEDVRDDGLERAAEMSARDAHAAVAPRAVASAAGPLATGRCRVRGRVKRVRRAGWVEALRWLTGIALVLWLARGLAALAGSRREAEFELVEGAVKVRRTARLFGRVIRESTDTYVLAAIAGAGRETRFPALGLVVGAFALAAGILVGGLLGFDGIRAGEPSLLALGAIAVLLGAGLDLALEILLAGRAGRVVCALRVLPRREVRIDGVVSADADRFLDALEAALER